MGSHRVAISSHRKVTGARAGPPSSRVSATPQSDVSADLRQARGGARQAIRSPIRYGSAFRAVPALCGESPWVVDGRSPACDADHGADRQRQRNRNVFRAADRRRLTARHRSARRFSEWRRSEGRSRLVDGTDRCRELRRKVVVRQPGAMRGALLRADGRGGGLRRVQHARRHGSDHVNRRSGRAEDDDSA